MVKRVVTSIITVAVLMGSVVACGATTQVVAPASEPEPEPIVEETPEETPTISKEATEITNDTSERSIESEHRIDNINYLVKSLPLIDSQTFAECFVDTFATETGLGHSGLFTYVDFVVNNGASEENLGLEYFLAVKAALTTCNGFLSQGDVQRVAEIIEETESEEEALPVLVGDEESGIYYYVEDPDPEWGELYFETIGNGPIKVIMSDIFGYETNETHGHRVKDTFLTFAQSDTFTLFTLDGGSGTSFEAIHTNETVIISASSHFGDLFEIGDDSYAEVENLKATNALYLSSLENAGIDGDPELGVYPYPHAGNAYVIENDSDAIEQTIFVAWYWDFSEIWDEASSVSTRSGSVDLHGGFVQRNLEDIIFVQIPKDYEFADTSHATPIAAALAVDLLAQNPNASAEELKQLLLAETILVGITIEDLYYDEAAGDSPYVDYSEIMTVNILPSR